MKLMFLITENNIRLHPLKGGIRPRLLQSSPLKTVAQNSEDKKRLKLKSKGKGLP